MKFNINRLIIHLVSVSIFTTTACQFKQVEKNRHESAKSNPPLVKTEPEISPVTLEARVSAQISELDSAFEKAQSQSAKITAAEKVIEATEGVVLNKHNLNDPKLQGSPQFIGVLGSYNRAMNYLADQGKLQVEKIENYALIAMYGCNFDLQGCIYGRFFSRDAFTSRIIVQYANAIDNKIELAKSLSEPDKSKSELALLREYYRALRFSKDIRNTAGDLDLDIAFARHVQKYAELLNNLPSIPSDERRLLDRIGKSFEVALKTIRNSKNGLTDPRVQKIIEQFNPWSFSRLDAGSFTYGLNLMFSLAARSQLYTKDGELNPGLQKIIANLQINGDKYGPSLKSIVDNLKASKITIAKKHLNQFNKFNSEIFYLVDRLYRSHLLEEDANDLWQTIQARRGTAADKELNEVVDFYVRAQFINLLDQTIKFSQKIFSSPELSQLNMVEKVIRDNRDLYSRWSEMLRNLERIKGFLERAIVINPTNQNEIAVTKRKIETLPRNIKYRVVYPIMMISAYFLKKLEANLTLNSWWGKIQIAPGVVIQAFLEGLLSPWFRFGNDAIPLNKVELLYAFSFALDGGVFEAFQEADIKDKVTYEKFFNSVIGEYLSVDREVLLKGSEALNDLERNPQYGEFQQLCAGGTYFDIRYKNLSSFVLSGSNTSNDGLIGLVHKQIYNDATSDGPMGIIKTMSSTLPRKIIFVQAMVEILDDFLKKNGVEESERTKVIGKANTEIVEVQQQFKKLYDRTFDIFSKTKSCFKKAINLENEYRLRLVQEEQDYLAKVWEAGQTLKGLNLEQIKAKVTTDPNFTSLPLGHDNFIEGPKFRISTRGIYARMIARLEKKLFAPRLADMPLQLSVINLPNEDTMKNENREETIDIVASADPAISKQIFMASAMKHLNGRASSYLQWMEDPSNFALGLKRIYTMVTLYATGKLLKSAPDRQLQPREILIDLREAIDSIHIDDERKALLDSLGITNFYDYSKVRDLVFTTTGQKGLYDIPFEELKQFGTVKELGFNGKITSFLDQAKEFYQTYASLGFFTFKPEQSVLTATRDAYGPLVKTYDSIYVGFLNAVAECEQSAQYPCDKSFVLVSDTLPESKIYNSSDTTGAVHFLGEPNRRYHQDVMDKFHKDTDSFFNSEAK